MIITLTLLVVLYLVGVYFCWSGYYEAETLNTSAVIKSILWPLLLVFILITSVLLALLNWITEK